MDTRWSIPHLLICTLLLAVSGLLAQEDQSPRSLEESFEKVQQWMLEQEYARAESDLREILNSMLLQLGAVIADRGDSELAERAFREAVRAAVTTDRSLVTLTEFYLLSGQYEKGMEAVTLLLEINPIHPPGRHMLGKLQILSGEAEAASHALRDAYLAAPDQIDIGFTLGYSYLRRGDLSSAKATFDEIVERSSNRLQTQVRVGRACYETGFPEEGIRVLEGALEAQPESPEARLWMGHLLVAAGRPGEAQAYLKGPENLPSESRSVLLDDVSMGPVSDDLKESVPNLRRTAAFCYGKLGELQLQMQRYDQAVRYLESGIFWDPAIPGIRLLLASAYLEQQRFLEAVAPAMEALRDDPRNLEVQQFLTRLAIQLAQAKHLDKARECTEKLIEVQPDSAFLYVLRGRIQAEAGAPEAGLQDFALALKLAPDVPEAHYNSGVLRLAAGELESALIEFDQELALNPGHEQALFKKAAALVQLGRPEEAIPLLQRTVQLAPDLVGAYRQLASIQLEKKQWILAIANLETAARLEPENAEILLELSEAYRLAGRDFDAARALEKYRSLRN